MARTIDYERVATILVDALLFDDERAAEKGGVSLRTVQRYKERAKRDVKLSQIVAKKWESFEQHRVQELNAAIDEAIQEILGYLKRAAGDASTTDPDSIHAVAGAGKLLLDKKVQMAELEVFRRVIYARYETLEAPG